MSSKPVSGTKEWASHNVNCYSGCSNNCTYCYARYNAVRFKRMTAEQWPNEKLREEEIWKPRRLLNGVVMFPTTHDITPTNLWQCRIVLNHLLRAGNKVLIVSKPHFACVRELCKDLVQYRKEILFRFTINATDPELLKFWEPGAPWFLERLASLHHAHETGYQTSVSAEPLLEPWNVQLLVDRVRDYVTHSIWIGKANQLRQRTAWKLLGDHPEIVRLLSWQTKEKILEIYEMFRNDWLIKWKDSYKKVIGLDRPDEAGLDI